MGSSLLEAILDGCKHHMTELGGIWDYIGFESDERDRRIKDITKELMFLLDNRIAAENQLRLSIESDIENEKRDVTSLCQQLKLKSFFPPRDKSSFNLLKTLKAKTKELQDVKSGRQESFIALYKEVFQLERVLSIDDNGTECGAVREYFQLHCDPQYSDIKIKDDHIPSEEEIETVRVYQHSLNTKYTELRDSYNGFLQDVGRIAADIEYTGESDFERNILKRFEILTSNPNDKIELSEVDVLNDDVLHEMKRLRLKLVKRKAMLLSTCDELRTYLESMWSRLRIDEENKREIRNQCLGYKPDVLEILQEEVSKCQQMKWEQISVYYCGLLDDKEEVERKLLLNVTNSERDYSIYDLTEESVSSMEQSIEELKMKYEQHQPLYDTVENYQTMWLAYLDVERQMKDPNILSNRGGILLKTEKEKKRLLKELPKCELAVSDAVTKYESVNGTKFFVWENLTFKDYVEHLWEEFRGNKETTKYRRPTSGSQSTTTSPKRISVPKVK